jgi:hypothetical protein
MSNNPFIDSDWRRVRGAALLEEQMWASLRARITRTGNGDQGIEPDDGKVS